jgi:hypothetical protein
VVPCRGSATRPLWTIGLSIPIDSQVDKLLDPRADDTYVVGFNSIVVFHYILQIPGRRERDVSPPHPSCKRKSVSNGVVSHLFSEPSLPMMCGPYNIM